MQCALVITETPQCTLIRAMDDNREKYTVMEIEVWMPVPYIFVQIPRDLLKTTFREARMWIAKDYLATTSRIRLRAMPANYVV